MLLKLLHALSSLTSLPVLGLHLLLTPLSPVSDLPINLALDPLALVEPGCSLSNVESDFTFSTIPFSPPSGTLLDVTLTDSCSSGDGFWPLNSTSLLGLLEIADSGSFLGKVVPDLLEPVISGEESSFREHCFPSSLLGTSGRVWGIVLEAIALATETWRPDCSATVQSRI